MLLGAMEMHVHSPSLCISGTQHAARPQHRIRLDGTNKHTASSGVGAREVEQGKVGRARRQFRWGETGMQHGWGRTEPVGGRRVEEKEREKGLCKQGRQVGR